MSGGDAMDERVRRMVRDRVAARLAERGNRMATGDGSLDAEFEANMLDILDEVAWAMHDPEASSAPTGSIEYSPSSQFGRVGALRADEDLPPAEYLMAADVLFDAALPILVDDHVLVPDGIPDIARIARVLHHAIWRRFPPNAVAYAQRLQQRISDANQDSRQRLSRELHDRVAHGIAAGIQRVELALLTPPLADAAAEHLAQAEAILRAALADVRDLAVELHARVGHGLIDDAVSRYVENIPSPHVTVRTTGKPRPLPSWRAEELFAIIIEAIRNVRDHAGTAPSATFTWEHETLTVTISDTGPGFDPTSIRPGAIGLADMAERAAVIGARFRLDAAPGHGTTVTIVTPTTGQP